MASLSFVDCAILLKQSLEMLSSGMTIDEILADYEDLERDDILAALTFAAQLSRVKRLELVTA